MWEAHQCILSAVTLSHAQTWHSLKWSYFLPKETFWQTQSAGMLMGLCRQLVFHQFSACWRGFHKWCNRVMLIGVNQSGLGRPLCRSSKFRYIYVKKQKQKKKQKYYEYLDTCLFIYLLMQMIRPALPLGTLGPRWTNASKIVVVFVIYIFLKKLLRLLPLKKIK